MRPLGILYVAYKWQLGQNCHLENILCRRCKKPDTATVLHLKGAFYRMHVCQYCGAINGPENWHVVADEPKNHTPAPTQGRLF